MQILQLVVLALIGESVWETLKMVWQEGKLCIDRVGALVIGLLVAFVTGADILALINMPAFVPYVGIALTGILISRGANFVHDLIKKIQTNPQQ